MTDIRTCYDRPAGNRILGNMIRETDKAVQFVYYDWVIWIPKSAITKIWKKEVYTAPAWAIDSAKKHESAKSVFDFDVRELGETDL